MTSRKETWKKQGSYRSFKTGKPMILEMDKSGVTVLSPLRRTLEKKKHSNFETMSEKLRKFDEYGHMAKYLK